MPFPPVSFARRLILGAFSAVISVAVAGHNACLPHETVRKTPTPGDQCHSLPLDVRLPGRVADIFRGFSTEIWRHTGADVDPETCAEVWSGALVAVLRSEAVRGYFTDPAKRAAWLPTLLTILAKLQADAASDAEGAADAKVNEPDDGPVTNRPAAQEAA